MDKDGPSPPPDLHTSSSSGGASLSMEERFSLLMDRMDKQSQHFATLAAVFDETQRQSAEAKESKYLFLQVFLVYCLLHILYIEYVIHKVPCPYSSLSFQERRARNSKISFTTQKIVWKH